MTDPKRVPKLSPSIAHVLLTRSCLHAWQRHSLLGGTESEPDDAKETGKTIEKLLLGGAATEGKEEGSLVVFEFDDWKTKEAQAVRKQTRFEDKIPVLAHRLETLNKAVPRMKANAAAFGIQLGTGEMQVRTEWKRVVETQHGPDYVDCKGFIDRLDIKGGFIDDLKTCSNAHPSLVLRLILKHGYDVQGAAYLEGTEALHPELAGRLRVRFIFVETKPPYAVQPYYLDGAALELGQQKWARACKSWKACLMTNTWPSYGRKVLSLDVPTWALNAEAEEEMRVEMDEEEDQ